MRVWGKHGSHWQEPDRADRTDGRCVNRALNVDLERLSNGPTRSRRPAIALGVAAACAALLLSACEKKTDEPSVKAPKAPSAAEVERNAVSDFEAPQPGLSTPNPNASFAGPFTAGGMEPFWAARLSNGKLTFERPEAEPLNFNVGNLKPKDGVAKVTQGKLTMILSAQSCTDDAGRALDYRMLVVYGGEAYEGCARVGEAVAAKDWSAFLGDYLIPIDACLARAAEQGFDAKVTIAYPRTRGHTAVRLSSVTNGRFECSVDAATGAIKYFDPLGTSDVMPGEWAPMFTRAPAVAPSGACNRNVPATNAAGAQIGWLTYESC